MAKWHPSQTSFSAGEITARALARVDSEVYREAALRMQNMMPRSQGPATRMPGSQYLQDFTDTGTTGRVIPMLTVDGRRSLIVLQDDELFVDTNIVPATSSALFVGQAAGSAALQQQIAKNPEFDNASADLRNAWEFTPSEFISKDGSRLGCRYEARDFGKVLSCVCRDWKYPDIDNESFTVRQEIALPGPRNNATIDWRVIYADNPGEDGEEHAFQLTIGTTLDGTDVLSEVFDGPIGTVFERALTVTLPTDYDGVLYVKFFCVAQEFASGPVYELDRFQLFVDADALPDEPPVGIDPDAQLYAEADLADVQYVQSPYGNKEVIFTHPNYPPQWLYYDPETAQYVFEPITFTDTPDAWGARNYPAACGAYQGRLLLGGTPMQSETVWGTRPGQWDDLSENPDANDPNLILPDSAIEFTTIYRSPIQWIYGHKDLLIGTRELEYVVTADSGLLQPGDIDVRLHSSHGSLNVQPIGIGQHIAFAAERGTRIRGLKRTDADTGWVAPDLSERAEHMLSAGVKRIARMRNPHEMLLCLTNTGNVAILHYEQSVNMFGWTPLELPGDIIDVCALPQDDGTDAFIMLVRHTINGVSSLYLEGIFGWVFDREWSYLSSSITQQFNTTTSTITGLDHLEGERVQVFADRTFLGAYLVTNGQVSLEFEGGTIEVSTATVGLGTEALMRLLPPETDETTGGSSSFKRYSNITVRTIGSTRPVINGTRPASREPRFRMNESPPLDILQDNDVANLGTDRLQLVEISETLPFKLEVVSISGTLTSDTL